MVETYEMSYIGGLAEIGDKIQRWGVKNCEDTML